MSEPVRDLYGIVQIMGRKTRAGVISDAKLGGATLLRVEHPTAVDHTGHDPLTEFYAPQALFSIRPCSRDEAIAVAAWAWRPGDLPVPELPAVFTEDPLDDDLDPEDDG